MVVARHQLNEAVVDLGSNLEAVEVLGCSFGVEAARRIRIAEEEEFVDSRSRTVVVEVRRIHRCTAVEAMDFDTACTHISFSHTRKSTLKEPTVVEADTAAAEDSHRIAVVAGRNL